MGIWRRYLVAKCDWNHGFLNDFPFILGMENHPNWLIYFALQQYFMIVKIHKNPKDSWINRFFNNPPISHRHVWIPSGKRLHSELENHHFSWVNPLFLWPFSMSLFVCLPEGNPIGEFSKRGTPRSLVPIHNDKLAGWFSEYPKMRNLRALD